ncbi:MAG: phosphotransferase family protein [Gammaproteobacteria bacterium]|nr:phosphotransferase family protein [Gammaproteobacteria bacterium]
MPMAGQELDLVRLGAYLERQIAGFRGLQSAEKFAGGQSNPTYLLRAASGRYVLRRKPTGQLLESAHAVDREYRVICALAATGVPVARGLHLCADDAVIGSMFYVMSFADGRVYWDPALPELDRAVRADYHRELVRVMAAIHGVDVDAVGLADYGKPGDYFARQIARWTKQYRAAETGTIESMNTLVEWLPANVPPDDGQRSLIHGDYRIDNVVFARGAPRALAVLDWELSTLGHPLADLAYYCMCLRLPPEGDVRGLAGKDRRALGVPEEPEIVDQYCRLRGLSSIGHWHFYLSFSYFRIAAICQGVYKRALSGNASNSKALEIGRLVAPLADAAVALIGEPVAT